MPKVVVVIPLYKPNPNYYEYISLSQCFKVLKDYPIRFVTHEKLIIEKYHHLGQRNNVHSIGFEYFDPNFFAKREGYNRLLISMQFYERFKDFQFILIYHPDSFVFDDSLEKWCSMGYDYVGAPWLTGLSDANINSEFIGVGNGGFSLRRVSAHLKALNSLSYIKKPRNMWKRWKQVTLNDKPLAFGRMMLDLTIRNNTFHWFNNFPHNEDLFWGIIVNKNFEWFRIPPPLEALDFSFEAVPHKLYRLNHNNLSFGCHGWYAYNFDFWRPHIEKFGYKLPKQAPKIIKG